MAKWVFLTLFIIVFLSIVLGGIVYALSNGGMNIVEIFRSLAECKDTYGEVANEVDTVVRDMEYFGHDLRTDLRNTSRLTPSAKFQDLAHNLLAVIDSGGGFLGAFDLDSYKRMFFHASLLQGFCSGLIAGVMGEGSVMSGLKHSIIMMTIALLIFKLAVGGV